MKNWSDPTGPWDSLALDFGVAAALAVAANAGIDHER